MNAQRLTAALLLSMLVMLGFNLKVRQSAAHPRFDPEDETAFFRAESAMQYRYARWAAAGRPLPRIDKEAQWPEGVDPRRELTPLMERLTGLSYRWLGGADFRWFVVLWVAFVSSLSILAFYLCAIRLMADPALALAATAAYGLSWAAQCNEIASYRLETLGLPLIFGSLACIGTLLQAKKFHRWGAASAALLLSAFATWHLSRFYLATLLLALGFAYWRTKDRRLKWAAFYSALAGAFSLLLIPSARQSLFIFSPGAYGHVYGLVFAKLRHGFRHPADPGLLSAVQRLEWTGPSNSPDLGFLIFSFIPLALVLIRKPSKEARPAFGVVVDALFWIYAAGTALASRLTPWLAFFLVLRSRQTRKWVFLAVAFFEVIKCVAPASPWNPVIRLSAPFSKSELRPSVALGAEKELLFWLREHGGPAKPALAPMGLSAEILAYSDTPVLLHPKWEAAGIRAKTADFVAALYGSESGFKEYAERHGAKLFVYTADAVLDETPDGLRYASGRMKLDETSAAYKFHFTPQALKDFKLLFENESFRVFGQGRAIAAKNAVYDRRQYGRDLDCAAVIRRMDAARLQALLGLFLKGRGRKAEARAAFEESFSHWPPDERLLAEYNSLKK